MQIWYNLGVGARYKITKVKKKPFINVVKKTEIQINKVVVSNYYYYYCFFLVQTYKYIIYTLLKTLVWD